MKNSISTDYTTIRSFIEQRSCLTWIADTDDNIIYANQSFLNYFRLNEKRVPGNINEIFQSEMADYFRRIHHLIRNGRGQQKAVMDTPGTESSDHLQLIHSFLLNGSVTPALVAAKAVIIQGTSKLAETVESQNLESTQVDRNTFEPRWEWNIISGEICRNRALTEITGHFQDPLLDMAWWFNRIPLSDRERVQHGIAAALESKLSSWNDEYPFQCLDGTIKFFRDKAFILYENNRPTRMFGTIEDVTEITQLRQQLQLEKQRHQREIAEAIVNAQERERMNIGNELHDNINQIITTVRLYLDMIQPASEQDQDLKSKTGELISMAYDEIRKLSRELVSPQLKGDSLIESIHELITDLEAASQFKITFLHDPAIWTSRSLKIALFRIVQEQLKNIVRYSEASEVLIELQATEKNILLAITDNGKGFDLKATRNGIGLSNIRERVRLYAGEISIDTAPGAGCRITVNIPV